MDNTNTTLVTNEFGEGEYGQRMSYGKPVYRDLWAGVLYYVHVFIIVVVAIYLWATQVGDVNGNDKDTLNFGGIFVTLLACMVVGTICGIVWLAVIKRYASNIIKGMLFLNIALWLVTAVIGVATGAMSTAVIGFLFALFFALYTWCVWKRIPFASALLSIASTIVQKYPGTIYISLSVILFNILWILVWFSTFVAYVVVSQNKNNTNDFIVFILLISFYWGLQVNTNVSHTTTCGVAATWYFAPNSEIHNPSRAAFKRTMTTSFGSVCLGSLIVAILEAIQAMVRQAAAGNNGICTCIALCILNCITQLVRIFNTYAFAHVAIYGTNFFSSGKATWDLFKSRGFEAIINDDLSGMALVCGALISLLICAGVGCLGFAFYTSGSWYPTVPIILIVAGAVIGYIFCISVLMVIRSSVVALFVCYAEDPATMANNRPEEYDRIVRARAEWANICVARSGGGGQNNNYNQQQQPTSTGEQWTH